MRKISKKRQQQNELYKEAKANVRKKLLAEGKFVCFFSETSLPPDFDDFHHLEGKDGEMLYKESNIRPAIWTYHYPYHHTTVGKLLTSGWYPKFLKRIEKQYPQVFNIEMRKFDKAGIKYERGKL